MNAAWHFEITVVNEQVSVYEYQGNDAQVLMNNGEESWAYDPDFWQWLAHKIEYDGEPISFVVLSDGDDIAPPDDMFNLASQNACYQPISSGCTILGFPALSDDVDVVYERSVHNVLPPVKKGTLQDYFVSKTRKYQHEK